MISTSTNSTIERVLEKISRSGGIPSISTSSLIFSTVAAFSDEIKASNDTAYSHIKNSFPSSANSESLERIGVGMGLPRLVSDIKEFTASSGVIYLEYYNKLPFPEVLNNKLLIKAGEILEYDYFYLVIKDDVLCKAGEKTLPISAAVFPKVEVVDSMIASGSAYQTSLAEKIGSDAISLKFSIDIRVSKIQENIEDYRKRILFRLSNGSPGSVRSIKEAVMSASSKLRTIINKAQDGGYSIWIADNSMHTTGMMPLFNHYEKLIESAMDKYATHGVRFKIKAPERAEISLKISYPSGYPVPAAITDSFLSNYEYGVSISLREIVDIAAIKIGLPRSVISIISAEYLDVPTGIAVKVSQDESLRTEPYCFSLKHNKISSTSDVGGIVDDE
jgi:hypothetical protein